MIYLLSIPPIIIIAALGYFLGYRNGQINALDYLQESINTMIEAHEGSRNVHEDENLFHCEHMASLLRVIDENINNIDSEHRAIVENIRPFYEISTIH